MKRSSRIFFLIIASAFVLAACRATSSSEGKAVGGSDPSTSANSNTSSRNYDDLDIVTLLPPDAIPAIDNPQFLLPSEADTEYAPDELILGVAHNGEAKAYSTGLLSSHEIVNDTIGGAKIAVTW